MLYVMNEGTLPIPDHWIDHSLNTFTLDDSHDNLMVSRQKVNDGRTLEKLLSEHIQELQTHLKSYKRQHKKSLLIDNIPAIQIDYSFDNDHSLMRQTSVLVLNNKMLIVFTCTFLHEPSPEHKQAFLDVIYNATFNRDSE